MTASSHVAPGPPDAVCEVVRYACMAPSVHNTQPWSWRADGNTLELYADARRQLMVSDAEGCNLAISCGAALHHAQVAARGLGWKSTVTRLPHGESSALLATIDLTRAPSTQESREQLQAIRDRRTDRRRFTSWPVPESRLRHLADAAAEWGADAVVVADTSERVRTELLVGRALDRQAADAELVDEQRRWVNHSSEDGIPGEVIPAGNRAVAHRRSRFGDGLLTESSREFKGSDGLLVMRGATADIESWLRTGEGLSALWLLATREGLSVVPLSQAIEVDETRERLRVDVLHGEGLPHLLVRVGWQAIGRQTLAKTPRRALSDVLALRPETCRSG